MTFEQWIKQTAQAGFFSAVCYARDNSIVEIAGKKFTVCGNEVTPVREYEPGERLYEKYRELYVKEFCHSWPAPWTEVQGAYRRIYSALEDALKEKP